jgi:hypothetical protein
MTDPTDPTDPDADRTTTCPACGTTNVTQTNTQDVHYRYTRNADHTTPTITVPILRVRERLRLEPRTTRPPHPRRPQPRQHRPKPDDDPERLLPRVESRATYETPRRRANVPGPDTRDQPDATPTVPTGRHQLP